jgi:uncharacterized protein (UPF0548 family)
MFLFTRPTEQQVRDFLHEQNELPFSYAEVGISKERASPAGYNADHNRIQLGTGAATFQLARQAIQNWQMFNIGWVKLFFDHTPIEVGRSVAPCAKHFGFYSLNVCRIVYTIDEERRYGFAYGTLCEHIEQGEERFLVEWNPEDDAVWYDLFAFSKPRNLLARLGYPVSRALQKRFAEDSKQAMRRAVQSIGAAE